MTSDYIVRNGKYIDYIDLVKTIWLKEQINILTISI